MYAFKIRLKNRKNKKFLFFLNIIIFGNKTIRATTHTHTHTHTYIYAVYALKTIKASNTILYMHACIAEKIIIFWTFFQNNYIFPFEILKKSCYSHFRVKKANLFFLFYHRLEVPFFKESQTHHSPQCPRTPSFTICWMFRPRRARAISEK